MQRETAPHIGPLGPVNGCIISEFESGRGEVGRVGLRAVKTGEAYGHK